MKRSSALAVFLVSALLLAVPQASASAPKASAIAGTVVKEPGSEPLKKVLVQIVAENQKEGFNYTATTDADGRFHVDNVTPGRYRIFFERTGFVAVNGHGLKADVNVLTIHENQFIDDLFFRMLPTAVISGRVTDEDGDPLSDVRIIAQKRRPGKTGRESVATAGTNDRGEYRISGLFPGQYWVVAIPPPDARDYEQPKQDLPANENASDGAPQQDTRYLTTYYPGTFDVMQASPVTLKAGDEMPLGLTLLPARTYRVRGIVTGISPKQKTTVELVSPGGDSAKSSDVGPDGQFEVRGVGPGSYVLRATSGTETRSLTARQNVSVVAGDVEGIKLTPQPSFDLTGHLFIDGRADVTQLSANLRQADAPEDTGLTLAQDYFGANSPVDKYGNFDWKNVNPGDYIVQVYGAEGQGLFLKSATAGGQDIVTGFTATGSASLELVMSTKGGMIEGAVIEKEKDVDNDHPVPNATVVAVPEEKFRKLPNRFVTGSTDQHGRFTLRGLPPGSYTVYAWQDLEDGIYRDATFLKSQESNGTAVKVEEGSRQTIALKLSPIPDEWR
jgi:protocatechuate 3,4-dioxygenase beta subunit